jgi:hypothetical protein
LHKSIPAQLSCKRLKAEKMQGFLYSKSATWFMNLFRQTLTMLFCLVLICGLALIPFVGADWTTYRCVASCTGVGTSGPTAEPSMLWFINQTYPVLSLHAWSAPTIVNGTVYLGDNGYTTNGTYIKDALPFLRPDTQPTGGIYALHASNGATIWNFTLHNGVDSSPAVSDGVVYAHFFNNDLYALNATNGRIIWQYNSTVDASNIFRHSIEITVSHPRSCQQRCLCWLRFKRRICFQCDKRPSFRWLKQHSTS